MKKVIATLMLAALAVPAGLMAQGGGGSKGDKAAQTEPAKPATGKDAKKAKDEKAKSADAKPAKTGDKKPTDQKPKN